MDPVADEIARLGAPPRHARLRGRFRLLRWTLALAAVLPPSCVYSLGRDEGAQLERLARDGAVAEARVTGRRALQGRGTTYRLTAVFVVGERTFEASETVPAARFAATAVGAPVEVTYLPADPSTNRIDRVDAARVARQHGAFVAGALALLAAFGFVALVFERHVRRALALLRDGAATAGTITTPARARRGAAAAHYVFRTPDGTEHSGRSRFREATAPALAPGDAATVLFDRRRPTRSALLGSLESMAVVEPREAPPRNADAVHR